MYNHNKAQQSKNPVHISWDILYLYAPSHIQKIKMLSARYTLMFAGSGSLSKMIKQLYIVGLWA